MPTLTNPAPVQPADTVETGRVTADRPFGLTLSRPSTLGGELNLTDVVYDPAAQMLTGRNGEPFASKKGPSQGSVNTPYKTTHDHSSWQDSKKDTYSD
ncbi:putative ATP-grasp-modified RiPP [Plantactinospora sp. S1510]|uniref:ATP-grasp-modified RiPP n=1 Tax=Plantactinospora alkalitolerans TaxID=2789879 RepID=A0ABS0HA71_9ACTN|nr:putative ATP-grasp-modified RiPP [Plantactinospora alkalitolerans]MBF9135224.1 putative ATP-grasp-modified RiPP [Plantactinospora alkalitolerans]